MKDVVNEVVKEADNLEDKMKDASFTEKQNVKGTSIETVLKVDKEASIEPGLPTANSTTKPKGNSVLIDSENNQYVLSKPGDFTQHVDDSQLLNDILLLLITCFIFSFLLNFLRLPFFFGFLLAGILLGPGGYIKNSVQVETISRGLGVVFIMFFLGLEFNFAKIKKVIGVSFFGFKHFNHRSAALLILTVTCFVIAGRQLNRSYVECIAVGASIFMSSTVVVLNFLEVEEFEFSYGRAILGILVMQDILLGFLLVLMPALANSGGKSLLGTAFELISALAMFMGSCVIIRFPATKVLKWLEAEGKREAIFILGSVAFCFATVYVGSYFKQSMELSCFVAGVMVNWIGK